MTDSLERNAHRAAGQAVAAVLHAAPVDHVAIEGIEISWIDRPDEERPRAELLADIAIGLAGVAAESRWAFGSPPPETEPSLTFYSFNQSQLDDLAEVKSLTEVVDPDAAGDVYFLAFRQATDLIADPGIWSKIERLADALMKLDLKPNDLQAIFLDSRPFRPAEDI
jgi:hypothetical protein